VVIAEAGEKSGALITARHGIAQGRSVFAVPAEIGSEAVGTNALIKQGIPPLLDPNDVLNVLSLGYPDGCEVYEPAVTEQLRSYGNKSKSKEAKPKQAPRHEQKKSWIHEIAPETISEITVEAIGETEERFAGASSERILAVLRGVKPLSIDEIVHLTGIPVSEVMAELTLMEIDGSVISAVGGRYISAQFN
jgi:DNA processing protein